MQLTHRDVKRILELVDGAASIGEIEFVHNGLHFRFSRDTAPAQRQTPAPPASPQDTRAIQSKQLGNAKEILVRAPAAGRFYRSPASDQSALVDASTHVEANQTIAVIKAAMRTTAVQARDDGAVKRTFANDGEFVEFDQPLFIVAVT
jgi:acetyl-CoA carboxylase biotin carboxyl carrier protein